LETHYEKTLNKKEYSKEDKIDTKEKQQITSNKSSKSSLKTSENLSEEIQDEVKAIDLTQNSNATKINKSPLIQK